MESVTIPWEVLKEIFLLKNLTELELLNNFNQTISSDATLVSILHNMPNLRKLRLPWTTLDDIRLLKREHLAFKNRPIHIVTTQSKQHSLELNIEEIVELRALLPRLEITCKVKYNEGVDRNKVIIEAFHRFQAKQ